MNRPAWAAAVALCMMLAIPGSAEPPFPVVSTVDAEDIAGRPVQLDAEGKLLPWPFPDSPADSYSSHFLSQWTILVDQLERQRLPYFYCCFAIDPTTYELIPDRNWANSTAYLRAMLEGFVERLYPYTGDFRAVAALEAFVDYEMENGLTPQGYQWARVPYPSADPGALRYRGWSRHGEDYVEPHVIGEDGYAYLRLYEMTGKSKYLGAAIGFADQLVKNYQPGDARHSPWPVRCLARDGRVEGQGMGAYSANVLGPITLFDELIRLKQGEEAGYARVRQAAWRWLEKYPLQNNLWVGYFEDVPPNMNNMNQVIPLELARYVLLHPEKDRAWQGHARQLIEWVRSTPKWPKYRVHGALVTTEQGDGANFCCNQPNQCCDSHTARLAAVEALYFARTGDEAYKEEAFRSFNWVTYFQGLPGNSHAPFSDQWWFTDEFTDGPRRVMDAFWAVPEWAPAAQSHLLGSSSVVTRIAYRKGAVTYSTFDPESEDVLRIDFEPASITAGGRELPRREMRRRRQPGSPPEGFTFDKTSRVLSIRHLRSGDIDIEGAGGAEPERVVTFDDPHRPAGSSLQGEYPTGLIDWSEGSWKIAAPVGKLGTFNLRPSDRAAMPSFEFHQPKVFAGIDIDNLSLHAVTVALSCGDGQRTTVLVEAQQLKRLRTAWSMPCTRLGFEIPQGAELRFDNLAYLP